MRRRHIATLVAAVLAGAGCQEEVTAPGACPEFCPGGAIEMVDSLFGQAVSVDTTVVGFVRPQEAVSLQLVFDPAATGVQSRAVFRFIAFNERLLLRAGDTVRVPVAELDSFRVSLPVVRRRADATNLELVLYRLPASIGDTVTFDGLDPFFTDSARIATVDLADSLRNGIVGVSLSADAFPTLDADGRRAALGVALRGADPAFASLGAVESGSAVSLTRFVKIDSAGERVPRIEARNPSLDLFTVAGIAPAPPGVLVVGGAPSGRSFFEIDFPDGVLDSTEVVRATLVLVPAAPVAGAPGDTLRLLAHSLPVDVGPKSPFDPIPQESLSVRSTPLLVGSTDTVRVDLTDIIRRWQADPDRPRRVVLRATPEGARAVEARFQAPGPGTQPGLRLTFIPPIRVGG